MTRPFLRVPPFPRHRAAPIARPSREEVSCLAEHREDPAAVIDGLRRWRVGSDFWFAPVQLPAGRDVLLCPSSPYRLDRLINAARNAGLADRAVIRREGRPLATEAGALPAFCGRVDPWSACGAASLIIADADDEWTLVAALAGRRVMIVGEGHYAPLGAGAGDGLVTDDVLERFIAAELLDRWCYKDPFREEPIRISALAEIMGQWRVMIEANRKFTAIFGVARWKQVTTDALLWDGTRRVRYAASAAPVDLSAGAVVLAWMARTNAAAVANFAAKGIRVGEIEDGMIRSNGLGANCVPPLSIVVDSQGAHFDPAQASELEDILQSADMPPALLARAGALRETIVARGIGKYGQGGGALSPSSDKPSTRTVLVAGQVEDDRSVLFGGAGLGNLGLLRRARGLEPGARIIYKPHPDVEAGHRKGHVPDASALEYADEIDRASSIADLLAKVDAVHVITSLAGFEALLRMREVTTHGVPFYAGWGLTRDVGPVPIRRTRRRTLDELVAATLILYPRYLDPVTRLPCTPELLVDRIATGKATVRTVRILFREALGRARTVLRRG